MGATLCIICAICYAIVILFGYIKRKMAKSVGEGEVKSGFSAGEVAYKILQSYNFKSKATIDDEFDDTEEKNEQESYVEDNRRRFSFEGAQTEEDAVVKEKVIFDGVTRVEDDINLIEINYVQRAVSISDDVYDSSEMQAVCIAAYNANKLVIEHNKPFKYSLISFFTFLPRLVVQLGWLFCCSYILGVLYYTETMVIIGSSIVMGCILFSLLDMFYPLYIKRQTMKSLIEQNIIAEDELISAEKVVGNLATSEITNCFGTLKFFLRKMMGYDI